MGLETDLELYALLGRIKSNIDSVNDKIISKERAYERIEECVGEFDKIRNHTVHTNDMVKEEK